ncbi:transcriptional regulator [Streptomyces sp. NPDC001404]|uniref:transcriptional regulator n=1 Tax=Streptomyces sp. NPDC001404 TaxID=3364571 RepID=UPI00369EC7CB
MRRREEGQEDEPGWLVWLKGILVERGYDVRSPRGGGKAKLSKETGLASSSVSRIMSGQVPDFESQLTLSRHLGVPLHVFLIRTGRAAADDFAQQGQEIGHVGVVSETPLTPEELAAAAGVPRGDIEWFATMVRSLRKRGDTDGSAAGGAAAEG